MAESEPSWRDLLREIISRPGERERLAAEMGVNPLTLLRWATGETMPRQQSLHLLLQALAVEHRTALGALLEREYPVLASPVSSPSDVIDLSSEFFRKVHEMRATTPHTLRKWAITRQVLQHAVRQLDPQRYGLAIRVVICIPPADDAPIRSLHEREGQGTPPWEGDLSHEAILLGADSLAGYVVMRGHPEVVQDLTQATGMIPVYRARDEMSAMAAPILFANQIAGCLLVSSRQIGYFASPARQQLVSDYAHLLALAFNPEEFYSLDRIDLRILPPAEVQHTVLASFQQRVIHLIQESRQLNRAQAELLVWQQIETELLASSFSPLTKEH